MLIIDLLLFFFSEEEESVGQKRPFAGNSGDSPAFKRQRLNTAPSWNGGNTSQGLSSGFGMYIYNIVIFLL